MDENIEDATYFEVPKYNPTQVHPKTLAAIKLITATGETSERTKWATRGSFIGGGLMLVYALINKKNPWTNVMFGAIAGAPLGMMAHSYMSFRDSDKQLKKDIEKEKNTAK